MVLFLANICSHGGEQLVGTSSLPTGEPYLQAVCALIMMCVLFLLSEFCCLVMSEWERERVSEWWVSEWERGRGSEWVPASSEAFLESLCFSCNSAWLEEGGIVRKAEPLGGTFVSWSFVSSFGDGFWMCLFGLGCEIACSFSLRWLCFEFLRL